jgi:hypothetical protein
MGFDDMLGDDHRKHRNLRKQGYGDHNENSHHDRDSERGPYRPHDDDFEDSRYSRRSHHDGDVDIERLVHMILANKKLMLAAALVIVAVIVLAVIFLLPMLGPALDYLDKSGVKGVANRVLQESGSGK